MMKSWFMMIIGFDTGLLREFTNLKDAKVMFYLAVIMNCSFKG